MDSRRQSVPPSVRQSNVAAMTSRPSRKMSAHTSTDSPAMRLTGYRPQSTHGQIFSMRKRGPVGSAVETSHASLREERLMHMAARSAMGCFIFSYSHGFGPLEEPQKKPKVPY